MAEAPYKNPLKKFTDLQSKYINKLNYVANVDHIVKYERLYSLTEFTDENKKELLDLLGSEYKLISKNTFKIKSESVDTTQADVIQQAKRFKKLVAIAKEAYTIWEGAAKEEAKALLIQMGTSNEQLDELDSKLKVPLEKGANDDESVVSSTNKHRQILEQLDPSESIKNIVDSEEIVVIFTVLYESEFLPYGDIISNFLLLGSSQLKKLGVFGPAIGGIGTLYIGNNTDKETKVVVICSNRMGMLHNAILVQQVVTNLRTNGATIKFIGSSGICAGIRDKVNTCDVIIPCLLFDYSTGKLSSKTQNTWQRDESNNFQFEHYWYPIEMEAKHEASLIMYLEQKNPFLNPGDDIKEKYKVHLSPFASGTQVIAATGQANSIAKTRGKLAGFDMEAFGIAFAIKVLFEDTEIQQWLIAKGVSDMADEEKHIDKDNRQCRAGKNAALVLVDIIKKEVLPVK